VSVSSGGPNARRARRAGRRNQRSDLGARIVAAVPAIAFAVVIVSLGGWAFAFGLILLGLACMHELYTMLRRTRPLKLAGFLGLIALVVAARLGTIETMMLVLVCCVPLTFALALAGPELPDLTPPLAVTFLGIVWIGLGFGHAMALRGLPHGGGLVVDVLVGTFVGDTAAYLGGRALGRRPLSPRISPNKTVEGLVIGFVAAIVGVFFAGLYQDWLSTAHALLIGAAVGLAAPVGDLFESAIKRGANTKDAGRLFGAHGGALDRLDAVLFSIVVGYWVWRALM
jgi:phosphatidate cytidylyltransferase